MKQKYLQELKEYQTTITNNQFSPLAYLIFRKENRTPINSSVVSAIQDFQDSAIDDLLPHGSGIDSTIIIEKATKNKISLIVPYHHMNESGFYVEWINYRVKVSIDFLGLNISISNTTTKDGDKYFIYDYLSDVFYDAFTKTLPYK